MFVPGSCSHPPEYRVLTSPSSQGVLNNFFGEGTNDPTPVDMFVSGSILTGSGLSSSAAMVVASTLGFLAVNDKLDGVTKGKLVGISVVNEKRVGVNSGG